MLIDASYFEYGRNSGNENNSKAKKQKNGLNKENKVVYQKDEDIIEYMRNSLNKKRNGQ